jgi:transcriptional regulator with XRE-family HTH domain
MDTKAIGKKLEELRRAKGITQAEVAEALGVSAMAVSLYENGERIPRDEVKIKIADFFKTPVSSIFFGE